MNISVETSILKNSNKQKEPYSSQHGLFKNIYLIIKSKR